MAKVFLQTIKDVFGEHSVKRAKRTVIVRRIHQIWNLILYIVHYTRINVKVTLCEIKDNRWHGRKTVYKFVIFSFNCYVLIGMMVKLQIKSYMEMVFSSLKPLFKTQVKPILGLVGL